MYRSAGACFDCFTLFYDIKVSTISNAHLKHAHISLKNDGNREMRLSGRGRFRPACLGRDSNALVIY